jgi:hypothetical protein
MKKILLIVLLAMFAFCGAALAAEQVSITWTHDGSIVPNGYNVYQRTSGSYDYTKPAWTGATKTATLDVASDRQTAFVVRAYKVGTLTGAIMESGDSDEKIYTPAAMSPSAPKDVIINAIKAIVQGLLEINEAIEKLQLEKIEG